MLNTASDVVASIQTDEASPSVHTVSLVPGSYATDVVDGYGCSYSGSLSGFTGCTFIGASPDPFSIQADVTTQVVLTFAFHFEQQDDAIVVFRVGTAEFSLDPTDDVSTSCGNGPRCEPGAVCASLDGGDPACYAVCDEDADCSPVERCVLVAIGAGAEAFGLCDTASTVQPLSHPLTAPCPLRADGRAECWGAAVSGETSAPPGPFSSIEAGLRFTCALRDDRGVECWGSDVDGQSSAPAGSYADLSAGRSHACGVRTDGSVSCWGRNVVWRARRRRVCVLGKRPRRCRTLVARALAPRALDRVTCCRATGEV